MKLQYILLPLLLIFIAGTLQAQRGRYGKRAKYETFEGGLLTGLNLSQLDGDYFTGFDKAGWYGGLRGVVNLTTRLSLNIELLFSQKGSKIPHGTRITGIEVRDRIIELNYAEVPFLLKYKLSSEDKSTFIEIGWSLARLLKSNITEKEPSSIKGSVYNDLVPEFNTFDYGLIGGIGYPIGKKFELALRYNWGLNKFYVNEEYVRPDPLSGRVKEVEFLRNYHLALLLSYRLF